MANITHTIKHTRRRVQKRAYRQSHRNSIRAISGAEYTLAALHVVRHHAIMLLCALVVLFGFLYVYFLANTVIDAVVRKEVQHDIAQTNSHVAELEVTYLSKKGDITMDVATELGFTRVAQKTYLERARYLGRAVSE